MKQEDAPKGKTHEHQTCHPVPTEKLHQHHHGVVKAIFLPDRQLNELNGTMDC
jgi:hypothetical protein